MFRVSKKVDSKSEFGAEILVRSHIVLAHAQHRDTRGIKLSLGSRERLALECASGCIVFRIEVDHQPFPGVIAELYGLAILVLKRESWEGLSCLQHSFAPFRRSKIVTGGTPWGDGGTGVLAH